VALTALAGDLACKFELVVDLAKGDGEPGAVAPARFRVFVDRASPGKPDGDRTIPVLDLLIDGEASAMIEEEVADLGIGERGICARGFARGSSVNLSSSWVVTSALGGEVDDCTGERGAEMDEGGVGIPRNCCSFSRRIDISLFASDDQLTKPGGYFATHLEVHPSTSESQFRAPRAILSLVPIMSSLQLLGYICFPDQAGKKMLP